MTMVNDDPAGGPSVADTARRGQASWRTTAAAGFLVLALIGGLVVALSGGDHDNDTGATTPAAAAPADPAPADPAPAGAAAVAEPAAPAKAALGDVTWELVSGRAVPSSPTAGPTKINGPVHAGYAHTRDGAVLAALNIYTRGAFTPGDGWLAVTTAQVEPGAGRDAFIKTRRKLDDLSAPPGGWGQTVAYRIASYTATTAVIEEVTRFGDGRLQVAPLTVAWRSKDWQLVLQPNGDPSPYVAQLADLSGFTAFSAGI